MWGTFLTDYLNEQPGAEVTRFLLKNDSGIEETGYVYLVVYRGSQRDRVPGRGGTSALGNNMCTARNLVDTVNRDRHNATPWMQRGGSPERGWRYATGICTAIASEAYIISNNPVSHDDTVIPELIGIPEYTPPF
jgi:hypothetical protein